jgi:ssDNA-binding Zn-finger/Zn-ribbon topoisomerase 1
MQPGEETFGKCPYCKSAIVRRNANLVYDCSAKYGFVLVCSNYPKCDAYIVHRGLEVFSKYYRRGMVADRKTRAARITVHEQFDAIWKKHNIPRAVAYRDLADMLKVPYEDCHIINFDYAMCQKVLALIPELWRKSERTQVVVNDIRQ